MMVFQGLSAPFGTQPYGPRRLSTDQPLVPAGGAQDTLCLAHGLGGPAG
ncbi:hypothetical protein GFS31_06200 [Leptolyngbya sp. BL0902]|nr:hypothetical protein GFS31_06200 [Leptolyngbya sp. BL0902]